MNRLSDIEISRISRRAALAVALAASSALTVLTPGGDALAASCGAANQRPCKLWERIPSCNPGLAEDFLKGRCVGPKPVAAPAAMTDAARARAIADAHAATAGKLRGVATCIAQPARKARLAAAAKSRDVAAADRLLGECIDEGNLSMLRSVPAAARPHMAAAAGRSCGAGAYQMLTVGLVGPSAAVIVGAGVEVGFAFDISGCGRRSTRFYTTYGWSVGPAINGGVDLVPVGLSMSPVVQGHSQSIGWVFSGKVVAGAAVGAWKDAGSGAFDGVSFALGLGGGADLGSTHRTETRLF